MSSLYELKENWKKVSEMLYEEEIDEQCIKDTLESIEGEIEDKAENYAIIIKELIADAETCKQEKLRLETRQKSFENRANFLKDRLEEIMKETGKTKFKTAKFSFAIQKNGGKLPLIIDDITKVPDEYFKHTEKELDKVKIREAIDSGKKIPFAYYGKQEESLRIK